MNKSKAEMSQARRHAAQARKKAQQQAAGFDWDRAIAGWLRTLNEVYGEEQESQDGAA